MKTKFLKNAMGMCIYLDDSLFKNNTIKIEKIIETFNLFPLKSLSVKSTCIINEGEADIDKLRELINCEIVMQYTKTRRFSKQKYSKFQMSFCGEALLKIIEFAVKNELEFEGYCFTENQIKTLQFVINDNDGTCITFDSKIFNIEEIKSKVMEIFAEN